MITQCMKVIWGHVCQSAVITVKLTQPTYRMVKFRAGIFLMIFVLRCKLSRNNVKCNDKLVNFVNLNCNVTFDQTAVMSYSITQL